MVRIHVYKHIQINNRVMYSSHVWTKTCIQFPQSLCMVNKPQLLQRSPQIHTRTIQYNWDRSDWHHVCYVWSKGQFTYEPRAVTMKLRELKRNWLKTVPRHLQNHVLWSQTLKCSLKSHVIGPSTKCYFNEFLFMRVLTHDIIEWTNGSERSECHGLLGLC